MPYSKHNAKKYLTAEQKTFTAKFFFNSKFDLLGISKCQLATLPNSDASDNPPAKLATTGTN